MPDTIQTIAKDLRELLEIRQQLKVEADDTTKTYKYRDDKEDEITDIHTRIGDLFNCHGVALLDRLEELEGFKEEMYEISRDI